ncbi:adhesin [uncultured Cedecea sp.]|uniref:adhesin n=1 Tax=uncultured Cedecea sp. TaxID=988762 RepID=UPI00262631F5|nr:adhesin [uncultured Cedecea sp.]
MLSLKGMELTQWWLPLQKIIKNGSVSKKKLCWRLIPFCYYLLGSLLLPSIALANYAPRIANPNDGYLIQLKSDSPVSPNPVVGTDGRSYYRVGNPIIVSNTDTDSVTVAGSVRCLGTTWGGTNNYDIPSGSAYHKLFIYVPSAGTTVEGKEAYRINNNLIMTVDTKMADWTHIPDSIACSDLTSINATYKTEQTYAFAVQFPLTLRFYINDKIIDGQVVVPAMPLAGYVRAFMRPLTSPTFASWSLNESTVPMRLRSSTLNVPSSCTTMSSTGQADTVNLRHGRLNALNYDSEVSERVFYTCEFTELTKVRLRLDYATDDDPQKRLPMVNSQNSENKIYSELTMVDEGTGQTGKDFKVDIKELMTIKIISRIQGTDAVAGDYTGSAWLIATFD